ncbi:MAG: lysophospholipid acyltransferase family protein [Ardenticatenia bacterium]|nr:lysophospholipid acyltransferase family protein [Ardenticatenia bacterium]
MADGNRQRRGRHMPWFYYLANWVLRHVLFPLFLRVTVHGLEHVPAEGPLIVVINHLSLLDPPLVGAYFPRDVEMMAKAELFHRPVVGWIVRHYGAFPVARGEADLSALKHAMRALKQGRVILMAPEGTRSKTHQLQQGKEGVALVAARTGAAVLPVALFGHEEWWRHLLRLRRPQVTMRIGMPIRLASERRADRRTLQAMTEQIMVGLANLLPPAYRGVYADRVTSADEQIA